MFIQILINLHREYTEKHVEQKKNQLICVQFIKIVENKQ